MVLSSHHGWLSTKDAGPAPARDDVTKEAKSAFVCDDDGMNDTKFRLRLTRHCAGFKSVKEIQYTLPKGNVKDSASDCPGPRGMGMVSARPNVEGIATTHHIVTRVTLHDSFFNPLLEQLFEML
jgi:hypothetical protein